MSKVIDASIGDILDIENIGQKEFAPIVFTAKNDLTDTFEFKVWNSNRKNSEIPITGNPLTISSNVMTLLISPEEQLIPVGTHYYEIFNTTDKRIYFKGKLQINN